MPSHVMHIDRDLYAGRCMCLCACLYVRLSACLQSCLLQMSHIHVCSVEWSIEISIENSIECSVECAVEPSVEHSVEWSIECSMHMSIHGMPVVLSIAREPHPCLIHRMVNRMLHRMFHRMFHARFYTPHAFSLVCCTCATSMSVAHDAEAAAKAY